MLGRSSGLLADELNALRNDLSGTEYFKQIAYGERTLLGTFDTLLKQAKTQSKSSWTEEAWTYFKGSCFTAKNGIEQLRFMKIRLWHLLV